MHKLHIGENFRRFLKLLVVVIRLISRLHMNQTLNELDQVQRERERESWILQSIATMFNPSNYSIYLVFYNAWLMQPWFICQFIPFGVSKQPFHTLYYTFSFAIFNNSHYNTSYHMKNHTSYILVLLITHVWRGEELECQISTPPKGGFFIA